MSDPSNSLSIHAEVDLATRQDATPDMAGALSVLIGLLSPDPLAPFPTPPALDPPDLLEDLPPWERGAYEMRSALLAIGNELARLEAARQALRDNFFPATADALLDRFEDLFGLPVNLPGFSFAQRRALIAAYAKRLTSEGTGREWEDNISAVVGSGWTYKEYDPAGDYVNLVPTPTFGYTTVGAAPLNWIPNTPLTLAGALLTVQTSAGAQAGKAMRVVTTTTVVDEGAGCSLGVLPAGVYTASAYVKGNAGGEPLGLVAGNISALRTQSFVATAARARYSVTFTADGATPAYVAIRTDNVAVAVTFFVDAIQTTKGTEAGVYGDGDSVGGSWTGTPGNSTSGILGQPRPYVVNILMPFSAAVAPPSGLAVAAATGGTLTGTYFYAVTAVTGFGETLACAPVSKALAAQKATLTWAAQGPPTVSYNVYRGASAGALYQMANVTAATFVDDGTITPGAQLAPTGDTSASSLEGIAWSTVREITPAHLQVNRGHVGGFLVGIDRLGEDVL